MEAEPMDTVARENGITTEDIDYVSPEYRDTRDRFIASIKEFRNSALENIDSEIQEQRRIHDNYIRSARNAMWQMNDLRDQKRSLESLHEMKAEFIEKQFEKLLDHSKVDALGIRDEMLLIKTTDLEMTNPATGQTLPLGQFEITLPLEASRSGELSVLNKTNARYAPQEDTEWQHPHVDRHGEPCFGSIETDMFDMLSKGEITGAFELLLQYLQTINPDDDYGKHWSLWKD